MTTKEWWMKPRRFEVWLADLSPRMGTEPGKKRPVVVVQTDLLNGFHPSTVVCPMTSHLIPGITILRVRVTSGGLDKPSDILVDQVRAIDNRRLFNRLGRLTEPQARKLQENLRIVLDFL